MSIISAGFKLFRRNKELTIKVVKKKWKPAHTFTRHYRERKRLPHHLRAHANGWVGYRRMTRRTKISRLRKIFRAVVRRLGPAAIRKVATS